MTPTGRPRLHHRQPVRPGPLRLQIDAALLACGWLRPPTAGGEPVLDATAVADRLAVAPTTARRYLVQWRPAQPDAARRSR